MDEAAPTAPTEARASGHARTKASEPGALSPRPEGALEALRAHPRAGDLVALAGEALGRAARARRTVPSAEDLDEARRALDLGELDAATPFGDVATVLAEGPSDVRERALAQALARSVLDGVLAAGDEAEEANGFAEVLWLAAVSPFDAFALPTDPDLVEALVEACTLALRERPRAHGRGPALVAANVLAASAHPSRDEAVRRALASEDDALVQRALASRAEASGVAAVRAEGYLMAAPGRPWLTALLGATGLLAVLRGAEVVGRAVFRLRRVAELRVGTDGAHVRVRREVLGRVLDEREERVPARELARVERLVRYPRLAFYAGLTALAVGSFVGVRTLVDGARAASPSLLAWGLGVVALGFVLETTLRSLLPGSRGTVALVLETRAGRTLVVGGLAPDVADRAARALASAAAGPPRAA